ncbi:MAG: tetratricopeptide repeat protein [Deltaproteobacteria bacterium]
MRNKIIVVVLLSMFVFAGCNTLPSPTSTIKPPSSEATNQADDGLAKIVQLFLPKGAKLTVPANPQGAKAVQKGDINGDDLDEILYTYQMGENPVQACAAIIKQNNGKWEKMWEDKDIGSGFDWAGFVDFTGGRVPEIILGRNIGKTVGNALGVYYWQPSKYEEGKIVQEEGLLKTLDITYSKLEMEDMPGKYGVDGIAELAIWEKDGEGAFKVGVYRNWRLISVEKYENPVPTFYPATEVYPYYFEKVAKYYSQKVEQYPNDPVLWYYLADSQVKAGKPEQALQSIQKGLEKSTQYNISYPSENQFYLVKGFAFNSLGKYKEAKNIFDSLIKKMSAATDQQTQKNLAKVYLGLGQTYQELEDFKKAQESFSESQKILINACSSGNDNKLGEVLAVTRSYLDISTLIREKIINKKLSSLYAKVQSNADKLAEKLSKDADIENSSLFKPANNDGTLPEVIFLAYKGLGTFEEGKGLDIYWLYNGKLNHQTMNPWRELSVSAEVNCIPNQVKILHGLNNEIEMLTVFDREPQAYGNEVILFKLKNNHWNRVWQLNRVTGWKYYGGKLTFSEDGVSEFTREGIYRDLKSRAFYNDNKGPYRYFKDTWVRQGDKYVQKKLEIIPSAYETLVQFVYNISKGENSEAEKLVVNKLLISKAKEMHLIQNPFGQEWTVDTNNTKDGIIKITSGPAKGVKVSFIKKGEQYLISDIRRN